MSLIDKVLNTPELTNQPPVLVDIGASGAIHFRWKKIAKYAVCIAFDPDDRKYGYIVKENDNYRKLYVFNCVVADTSSDGQPFYLTQSPYCSSFLVPRTEDLKPYAFADKFEVERETKLMTRTIPEVLQELNIGYIDWFKTDSQGLDLRIFQSLDDKMARDIKIAEFEPGIMHAYHGEDKLHAVLRHMDNLPFFLSEITVKGPNRISQEQLKSISSSPFMQKLLAASHKETAGWGEMVYLNNFDASASHSQRDLLLGWVIATLNEEFGLALQIATQGEEQYKTPIFGEMRRGSVKNIRRNLWKLRFMSHVWRKLF
ncbi:FkbM family methyltransferase [Chitinophaga varians]|uniref:FkbM family methyltransferase n=1 Tax=Chitinophaga varians TaxID=2202339 RepID=A0A847RLP1_9BACT|nr:FkbM family methyltransferase [Chitinophaga varians]NLR63882.1 FkbM family methyltransferase [Chitinophaga varians]